MGILKKKIKQNTYINIYIYIDIICENKIMKMKNRNENKTILLIQIFKITKATPHKKQQQQKLPNASTLYEEEKKKSKQKPTKTFINYY